MRASPMPEHELLARLVEEFRTSGYEGSTLSRISARTGLGKSSLYNAFPGGKNEMAASVLDAVTSYLDGSVWYVLESQGAPEARLAAALDLVVSLYGGGTKSCLLEVLTIGDPDPGIRSRIRDMIERFRRGFEKLALDAGAAPELAAHKAEDAIVAIHGALVVCRACQTAEPFARQIARLRAEFLRVGP